jgi:hypothetical protein
VIEFEGLQNIAAILMEVEAVQRSVSNSLIETMSFYLEKTTPEGSRGC